MSDIDPSTKKTIISQVEKVRNGFRAGKLLTKDQRLDQLRNLYYAIVDKMSDIHEAFKKDLNRSAPDNDVLELQSTLKEIEDCIDNLGSWMKEKRVWSADLRFTLSVLKTQYTPMGVVLVISPWNYPFYLSLPAVASAIAAGNTVVLKPSEQTPNVSRVMNELIAEYLDPEIAQVVEGGVPETSVLLNDVKFDKIMFTGSTPVGKIIAQAAAKNLTPALLELGGKSPTLVGKTSLKSLDVIAKRIVWAKFANSGQTCVAPDYVLVEKQLAAELTKQLIKWTVKFYGQVTEEKHEGYVEAPTLRFAMRLRKLIADTRGKVVYGHQYTEKELAQLESVGSKFVNPVIVTEIDKNTLQDEPLMKDELFGPILPIVEVDDITKDAVQLINTDAYDTPLALYIYSEDDDAIEYISKRVRSGGLSINDALMHVACGNLPFGGIGNSGTGNYHGIYGFKAFSHERAVFKQRIWLEFILNVRYPPATSEKARVSSRLALLRPWFPRSGPVRRSLLARLSPLVLTFVAFLGLLAYMVF